MFSGIKNFILSNTRNKWTVEAIGCVCVAVLGEWDEVGVWDCWLSRQVMRISDYKAMEFSFLEF